MFTDRFFEIPIKIVCLGSDKDANLGINMDKKEMDVTAKILPLQIEGYREGIDEDLDFVPENKRMVTVYMKSGTSFLVYWSIDEFEKRLNKFEEERTP